MSSKISFNQQCRQCKKLFAGQTNFTDQGIFFAHITFFAPPGTAVEVLPNINQLTENK
jgi:hypothetical protein